MSAGAAGERGDAGSAVVSSSDEEAILCPGCGYDLRGADRDQCSECGLKIDRAALKISGIAWAHRRQIGRVRAYLKTVWQIAANSKGIEYEMGRPQDAGDARAFWRVTAALLAILLVSGFLLWLQVYGGTAVMAIKPQNTRSPTWNVASPAYDFAVPWSAGATMPPVLPMCLVLWAFYATGIGRAMVRLGAYPESHRQRAAALMLYGAAPLLIVWLVIPLGTAAWLVFTWRDPPRTSAASDVLFALMVSFPGAAIIVTLTRMGEWFSRARYWGPNGVWLAAPGLLGLWIAGAVLLIAIVPWCVGFLWIVIDSLR